MSSVIIAGNTSGTITLDAPNVAGSTVLTLPTTSGTIVTSANFNSYVSPTMKNRIINGDMTISQRIGSSSLSISTGSQVYTVDRFFVLPLSSGCTAQRVSGISGFQNALRVTGASGNNQIQIGHKIESVNTADLVNQTITISFYAQASSSKTNTVYFSYANAVDNWSGYTIISSATFTATTTPQRFTFTFNAGANAGNGLQIQIADCTYGAGETLTITGFQLELGSSATAYEWIPIGLELMLCQRYYWKTFVVDTVPAQNVAPGNQVFNICTNNISNGLYFPVSMRATPTVTTFNPYAANSSFRVPNSTTDVSVTPSDLSAAGIGFFSMTRTAPSALHGQITASIEL